MKILIKNGRLIDPASSLDRIGDLAIANGRIVHLGDVTDFTADRSIDATGLIVAPGLVDLCARLREPGHEHEGLLETELAAALAVHDVRDQLLAQGAEPSPGSPAAHAAYIASELKKWGKVIADIGVKAD